MPRTSRVSWSRPLLVLAVAAAAIAGYVQFGDVLTLESLAERESELQAYQHEHPLLVFGLAWVIYVAVTGLSLPGAVVLTLACGWFFGLWRAVLLVSFASTAGATVAFLVSRYVLRDALHSRFGERLQVFNRSLAREGALYLFMLRLIPAVPFFVINVVMGLTPLRTWTFWWVSQLGMLPGTVIYVYAGSSVPSLATLAEKGIRGILSPQLLLAFALLGVAPLLLRKVLLWLRPTSSRVLTHADDAGVPPLAESGPHPQEPADGSEPSEEGVTR